MKLSDAHWDTVIGLTHSPPALIRHMIENGSPGNVLEIGCAGGGSALALMALVRDADHFIVTVDPWGNRPYATSGARYGDNFERGALATLGHWANQAHVNWHHFKMESLAFLGKIQPLGCWYGGVFRDYKWDTVFLDGEHLAPIVLEELRLVLPNLKAGGVIFVDNANHAQKTSPGGVHSAGTNDNSMENALLGWAADAGMDCKFIPFSPGDLLAEIKAKEIRA